MEPAKMMDQLCLNIRHVPARIFLGTIVIVQSALMDTYFIYYLSNFHYAWIAVDLIVLGTFMFTFLIHYKLRNGKINVRTKWAQYAMQPLGYVSWAVYSIFLVIKVAWIFKNVAPELKEQYAIGPNLIKMATALTTVIFLLEVLLHHHPKQSQERKHYIELLSFVVSLDILDSVDHLEVLFLQESRIHLTFTMENAILTFTCLNLMLPFVPLLELSRTCYGKTRDSHYVRTAHSMLHLLAVNMPFMIIRLVLWHVLSHSVSVFLIKNIIMIYLDLKAICDNYREAQMGEAMDNKNADPEQMEMNKKSAERDLAHHDMSLDEIFTEDIDYHEGGLPAGMVDLDEEEKENVEEKKEVKKEKKVDVIKVSLPVIATERRHPVRKCLETEM